MIALKMWVVKCTILFVILLSGNIQLVKCEILHLCSHNSQHNSCLTLSQFANNQTYYARPNTTLIFNGGNHTLATGIVVSNAMAFSMLSKNSSAAVINCHKDANMKFSSISEVRIRGLAFNGCGGNAVNSVSLLKIEQSHFHGTNSSATSFQVNSSRAYILDTCFLSNVIGSYRSGVGYFREINSDLGSLVGGALIVTHSTLTIDSCKFERNAANIGGAIFSESKSNITIINNSVFASNQATGCNQPLSCLGGALYIEGHSTLSTYNSTFGNNTSDQDGGMAYVYKSILIISKCIISKNIATCNGGAVYAYELPKIVVFNATVFDSNKACHDGGALYLSDLHGSTGIFINNCSFTQNQADDNGGAIFNRNSKTVINGSHFNFSFARSNGGALISKQFSTIFVYNSTFLHNCAQNDGGVIHADYQCKFVHCILFNNSAAKHGGILYTENLRYVQASYPGPVCEASSVHVDVQSSSFHGNTASKGGVFCLTAGTSIAVDSSEFHSSINVDTGAVIYAHDGACVNFSNSTFTDNSALYGGVLIAINNNIISIDNCTLSNNEALGNGGAIYVRTGCTLVIINSTFVENRAIGDGIVLVSDNSNMTAENSIFTKNFAGHDGGAIYVHDDSSIFVDCCKFNNNRADNSGGAIYTRNNVSIILNITSMNNNSAQTSGGGIHAQKESHIIVIESSNFINNTADYGGGVYAYVCTTVEILVSSFVENWANIAGGALATYESSSIAVESCNFTSNFAGAGGVSVVFQSTYKHTYQICHHDSQFKRSVLAFNKSRFLHNKADKNGVLYAQGSIINVANSVFYSNNAIIQGGAIYATSASTANIHATNFVNNKAYKGGAMALSASSSVSIKHSYFTRNRAHDNGGAVHMQLSTANIYSSTFNFSFSGKNGGVLAVINGSVKIESSFFNNNSVHQSGGVLYALSKSSLNITCSVFVSNTAINSGGVLQQEEASHCTVTNCLFLLNKAKHSGGMISLSSSILSIISSSFIHNSANNYGAVLLAEEKSNVLFEANMLACRCDVNGITFNIHVLETNFTCNKTMGIVNIKDLFVKLEKKAYIGHNQARSGGGIYAAKSSITFGSSVHFHGNFAKGNGGGISLKNSVFYSTNNAATITFESNRADINGGGIYIEDKTNNSICANDPVFRQPNKNSGCFFQNATKNLTILFVENQACRGHDLFGGLLDRCTAFTDINARPFKLKPSGTSEFEAISNLMNYDTVSSLPMRLCLCNKNHNNSMEPDCSQRAHKVNVKKKNDFSIHIAAIDQVNHTVPATIISKFEDINLTDSQAMQKIIGVECYELKYHVAFPNVNTYKLFIYPDGPCADKGISRLNISVNLMSCTCPPGFMQKEDSDTKCACVCDKFISKYIKRCNQSNKTVKRKGTFWIMYLNESTDSAKNVSSHFIYPYCPLNYCQSPSTPIHINFSQPNGSDAQCVNNRGGFLCRGCLPQYSLSFGSSRCIKCPKHWYGLPVGILLGILFAGLLLVFLVLVLNLTVAVGTLNALIFYANIIDANKSTYFGQESRIKFFPVFISWLNLNIGFDMCFFDGMDSYAKIWLELVFPIYILLLVILITRVSSRSSKLSKILGKWNPVATLATLILVSYAKLLEIIIVSFSFDHLKFPNGTVVTKWLPDASVGFNPWKHGALILMGILVLIFGLLYTALVLFWQLLLRCPRILFRFTRNQKLQSFVEAYHIPYNAKHRYWTGLLLLIRILVDLISTFTAPADPRIALLSTAVIMSSLLLYKTLLTVKVYKNRLLSATESFTLINIAILAMFTWYAFDDTDDQAKENLQKSVAYTSVGTIFILFLLVFIFHAYRYGNSKVYSLVRNLRLIKKLNEKIIQCDSWTTSHGSSAYNYNLFDLIDNRETDEYTPPPVKLQQEVSRSVVSVATSECQVAESDFAENQVEKN